MNRRFWCIICSLFLVYNLKELFDDFYSVNYKIVEKGDQLHDEVTEIAACADHNWVVRRNWETERNAIQVSPVTVNARSFLDTSIAMIENRLGIKNLFSTDKSFVFRDFFCFLLNQTSYKKDQSVKNFLKLYYAQLFTHSPGKQPFFFEYVYNNYHNNDSVRIKKQKVYDHRYLTNSNCRTPQDQFLASKFNCLRKCTFNSPTDFHPPDSRKMFDLTDLSKIKSNPFLLTDNNRFENDSNYETFRRCVKKCPRDDCFSETYNSMTVKDGRLDLNIESAIFRAYYSTVQFWSQVFGLFTLFTSTSVTHTVPHLMSLAAKKLKSSHQAYFVRFFPKFKLALLIFSGIFILAQSILAIIDYNFEKSYPNRTAIWNFSSKPFSVTICLPIETLIYNDSTIKEGRNSRIVHSLSFEQLENRTRAFENGVEAIRLLHGNRMKTLSWTLTGKVLFKNSSFNQVKCLSRCFRVELDFEDLKYRKMMPFYYLVVQFRTKFRELYLTERHQNLTSGLVNFKGDYFVRKTTEKALPGSRKSNCKKKKKIENSRKQIDRCINQKFIEEHPACLPANSVVDRDDFDDKINGYKFKMADITTIEHNCIEAYKEQSSCKEVRFVESMKKMNSYDQMSIRLNLNYQDSISKEIDQSFIMVVLHILNLELIFFRNNVASCLLFLIAALKRLFKMEWVDSKFDRFLVLSICILGFLTHNVFIFKGIVDAQLVENGYFKVMRNFRLPSAVFCFDLSKVVINENHRITGNHLNSLRDELRLSNIVEKVAFFNRTHYKHFKPERGSNNYSDSEITIRPIHLFDDFHCLEFQLNVIFDEED